MNIRVFVCLVAFYFSYFVFIFSVLGIKAKAFPLSYIPSPDWLIDWLTNILLACLLFWDRVSKSHWITQSESELAILLPLSPKMLGSQDNSLRTALFCVGIITACMSWLFGFAWEDWSWQCPSLASSSVQVMDSGHLPLLLWAGVWPLGCNLLGSLAPKPTRVSALGDDHCQDLVLCDIPGPKSSSPFPSLQLQPDLHAAPLHSPLKRCVLESDPWTELNTTKTKQSSSVTLTFSGWAGRWPRQMPSLPSAGHIDFWRFWSLCH